MAELQERGRYDFRKKSPPLKGVEGLNFYVTE